MEYAFKTITEFNDYFRDEVTCYRGASRSYTPSTLKEPN